MSPFQQNPVRADTVDKIVKAFIALPGGSLITYEQIAATAGVEIDSSSYELRRALDITRDKHNILMRNEWGVGYVKTNTFDDKRVVMGSRRKRVRKQSLVGLKEVGATMRGSNPTRAEMLELTRFQGAFAVSYMATGGNTRAAQKASGDMFEEPRPTRDTVPR